MEYTFNASLKLKMEEAGMTAAELSRLSGVTKQNISRLITNRKHPTSEAEPRVGEDTVYKLAKALNWDINEARLSAGFSPMDEKSDIYISPKVREINVLLEQLNELYQDHVLGILKVFLNNLKSGQVTQSGTDDSIADERRTIKLPPYSQKQLKSKDDEDRKTG